MKEKLGRGVEAEDEYERKIFVNGDGCLFGCLNLLYDFNGAARNSLRIACFALFSFYIRIIYSRLRRTSNLRRYSRVKLVLFEIFRRQIMENSVPILLSWLSN